MVAERGEFLVNPGGGSGTIPHHTEARAGRVFRRESDALLPIQCISHLGENPMKPVLALILAALTALEPATAATLYRWKDASGVSRYGYQPPPGVEAAPAEEERRELYPETEKAPPPNCRDLAEQHLKLVDQELQRVRAMRAGLGPEFELSPAAKQVLIFDLLAHRAALVTGRPAGEFRTPTSDEIERAKSRLQGENLRLQNELKQKEATLDVQQNRLNRVKREADAARHGPNFYGPGYYPWVPVPVRR